MHNGAIHIVIGYAIEQAMDIFIIFIVTDLPRGGDAAARTLGVLHIRFCRRLRCLTEHSISSGLNLVVTNFLFSHSL